MAARVRVEFSEHAQNRMKERRITRQQATKCLFDGDLAGFDLRGRKVREKKFNGRVLVVIYVDTGGGGRLVVTTYWKGILP